MTSVEAHEVLERIKAAWREKGPGGCKILSLGDGCPCVLCLVDSIHEFVQQHETGDPRQFGNKVRI